MPLVFSWFGESAYAIMDHPSLCLWPFLQTTVWSQWLLMWQLYWHTSPIDTHQVIWAYTCHLRCIFVPETYFAVVCLIFVAVYWFLVDMCRNVGSICTLQHNYSGTHLQCGRHICSGVYANNVECMPVVMVIFFIALSCLISAYDVIGINGLFVAFEEHIYCWHIYNHSLLDKVAVHCFVWLIYAVLLGLHVDYITSAVEHICVMWQSYMFRGICQ